MNGDPNLDLNWLRIQGHSYEPYADWIVELLAQRQAQKDRADNNADSIELLERRLEAKDAELAMLRDELREAMAAQPEEAPKEYGPKDPEFYGCSVEACAYTPARHCCIPWDGDQ